MSFAEALYMNCGVNWHTSLTALSVSLGHRAIGLLAGFLWADVRNHTPLIEIESNHIQS